MTGEEYVLKWLEVAPLRQAAFDKHTEVATHQLRLLHLVTNGHRDDHSPRFVGQTRGKARRRIKATTVEVDKGITVKAVEKVCALVVAGNARGNEAKAPIVSAA